MLLTQIEGFLEVTRRGNFSRAAEARFVTQPTLTSRLHALERELGEPLFARTRRGMRLTDAGQGFLPYAERAMRAVRDGRQALADERSASAGQLVLGAVPAVSQPRPAGTPAAVCDRKASGVGRVAAILVGAKPSP